MTFFVKTISIGLVAAVAAGAMAQSDGTVVRRIKLRKADPALVMLMLSGSQSTQIGPEISTIQKASGNGGFGNSGFAGGNNRLGSQFGNGQGNRSGGSSGSGGGIHGPGGNGRYGG